MSIARHHAEWLSLVEQSGPFLSMPVLLRVLPQGLDAHDPEHSRLLKLAREEWEEGQGNPALHRAWVRFVLTQTLEMPEDVLAEGQAVANLKHEATEHGEAVRPEFAVMAGGQPQMLVKVYAARQDLDRPPLDSRWKASCCTQMMELLHATNVRLGLVTNGERWTLVDAPRGETTGFASWYAAYWLEEKITLQAFRNLLSARRFFSVPEDETLAAMLKESAGNQQEVTDQLGYQVRKAVEVLIQSLDRADQDHGRKLLGGVPEAELYEAALTVMMRLVFLFSAEERGLLLLGDPMYDQHYAVSTLRDQLREDADQHGEEVVERRLDAWVRLLAAFRAVHGGATHHRLTLPAYGGHLFDPDRFPFLEGRQRKFDENGVRANNWRAEPANPLPVNNRTVLHLLEALQLLQVKVPGGGPAEARRLSFRALDIEQIGHVYEGLLDHTARRATEPLLGLAGTKDKEPEVALAEMERQKEKGEKELLEFLKEVTGRSLPALKKALAVKIEGQDASKFRTACGNDAGLWGRVEPFAGLVRKDTFDNPVVIPAGSVFVTEGEDRRSTGTHYTPKSLTEPIVRYTLEPLVYDGPSDGKPEGQWRLKSARDLLSLKVCDMATGSGAFLVQACRYLSERVMEAWEQAEHGGSGKQAPLVFGSSNAAPPPTPTPRITPFGDPARGRLDEELIPEDAGDRVVYARRLVAQRCLYGVDKNPVAVEMAKLSLWLLTLAKGKPFTFLDHAVRCGDSLLGISNFEQLWYFDLRGKVDQPRFALDSLRSAIERAVALRRSIAERPANDISDVEEQERQLRESRSQTELLLLAADLLVGDGLADGDSGFISLVAHFRDGDRAAMQRQVRGLLKKNTPFHWPLEFPEVFARGGFDAFMGNPPFMGGQKITGYLGTDYREYLVKHLAQGRRGSADLAAYFFLRAAQLLQQGGGFGLISTNTIAQGDTREVALDLLLALKYVVCRARSSQPWPGVASLEVSVVWVRKGGWSGMYVLDDKPVAGITPYLTPPGAVTGTPHRLKANEGKSYVGSYVLGTGFILSPSEAKRLIERNVNNRDVLFPYLTGEDINSRPDQSPSRWVVNFRDWPLDRESAPAQYLGPVAADYPDCLALLRERAKPDRDKLASGDATARDRARRWWQFARPSLNLYSVLGKLDRVLARSRVSNINSISFIPANIVCSEMVVLFLSSKPSMLSILQSAVHTAWLTYHSSSLRTDVRYTPSDCFDNFPFPASIQQVEAIGDRYDSYRRDVMLVRKEGLTKTYNRFHERSETSDDIATLRRLHVEMDQAVATAYGWADLDLGHGFHQTKQVVRYTISESARQEVLARLLTLNHQRHAEEESQGLHEKKKASKPRARKAQEANSLFD